MDIQAILKIESGFLGDCLRGGRVPKLVGNFSYYSFQNKKLFMPDKYILKVKIHLMRSSGFHGICNLI